MAQNEANKTIEATGKGRQGGAGWAKMEFAWQRNSGKLPGFQPSRPVIVSLLSQPKSLWAGRWPSHVGFLASGVGHSWAVVSHAADLTAGVKSSLARGSPAASGRDPSSGPLEGSVAPLWVP